MIKKIDRYEIKSEIGRGGMATVYHAYDPRFGRDVAIKVLPREFLHEPQFRTRFEREAKTIAALEHHSIVPLYDFGEDNEMLFIVFRMMSGGSLAESLKHGPLPIADVVNIISRVASALDAAHARGIIHRDLKPSNILLDQYGSVFLSDFGIARLVDSGGMTTLTGSAIIGTPAYMSPEQIQGDVQLDGRSDIYALGVILYQMLTGELPYKTDSATKAIMANILEPVPSVLKLRPDLSPAVDDVVQRALAKDRNDRFATAGEFAIALQAAVYGEINGIPLFPTPLSGHTITTSAPIKKQANWRLAFLFTGLLIIATIGGIFYGQSIRKSSTLSTVTQANLIQPSEMSPIVSSTPPILVGLATVTNQIDTVTPQPLPSLTSVFSDTTSPSVIGGADKVAFFRNNEIWIMNLDGSDLTAITQDKAEKKDLHWLPDGRHLSYIVGKCVKSVSIDNGDIEDLFCFEAGESLDNFVISPDNASAAIILNHKMYLISYNLALLKTMRSPSDLRSLGICGYLAPYDYKKINIKKMYWSYLSTNIAVVMEGYATLGDSTQQMRDVIQLLDNSLDENGKCRRYLPVIDQFPYSLSTDTLQIIAQRFVIKGYDINPIIQNFGWDGGSLFAFVGNKRNGGFGDLYIYNASSKVLEPEVNPINNSCCYRDPQWSPDGRYLMFVYQPEGNSNGVPIQIYYVKYATLEAERVFSPIPIPTNFFSNPLEAPQPTLRIFRP